jgi:hypothetical protein
MMNLSEMITSIKMDLGIYGLSIPLENEEKKIHDVIKLKTIKTFSQFSPHIMRIDLDMKTLKVLKSNYNESIYVLPDVFGDRKIITIRKVEQKNKLLGNGYVSPILDDSIDLYGGIMMGQAAANLSSTVIPPFTFKFTAPNLLHLFNMSTMANEATIEIGLEHHDNLMSIPNTSWESFYELAILDLKHFYYGILKHYNQLQTAHGTIDLHIDDWASAFQERKDLIERWRDMYHLDAEQFYII